MTTPAAYSVRKANWNSDADALMEVRRTVFIEEQNVPPELERDGLDPDCAHVIAIDGNGKAIGTGRLMPEGRIGRVAVLESWRRRGVGAALMRRLVKIAADRGQAEGVLCLHAQSWTIPFYESFGFVADGEEFDEAGIPHRAMVLRRSG